MSESLCVGNRVVYRLDPVEPEDTHRCPECSRNLELRHCSMLRGDLEIPGWFIHCPGETCNFCATCFVPDCMATLPGITIAKEFSWWLYDNGKADVWDEALYDLVTCLYDCYNN